jgi:hypothetical protein
MNYELITTNSNGDDRARTDNLRLAKPALSQLSYVPEPIPVFSFEFLTLSLKKTNQNSTLTSGPG